MSPAPPIPAELLPDATQRLLHAVDALTDDDLAAPSLLPGWTRAHVVAHLALNGEALERVLTGAAQGRPRPMYDSAQARDEDIAALAGAEASELRSRLLAVSHCFERAAGAMGEDDWAGRFERTPGAPAFGLANVPMMRLTEVEVHHADLGTGYTAADWPDAFAAALLESMTRRSHPEPFRVLARDLARTWQLGDAVPDDAGLPTVSGDAAALAWWLTGRGDGAGLSADGGALPEVPAW